MDRIELIVAIARRIKANLTDLARATDEFQLTESERSLVKLAAV